MPACPLLVPSSWSHSLVLVHQKLPHGLVSVTVKSQTNTKSAIFKSPIGHLEKNVSFRDETFQLISIGLMLQHYALHCMLLTI